MDNENVDRLISEVEKRPYLWSKGDKSYRDAIKVKNGWEQVAKTLNSNSELLYLCLS